MCVCPLELLTLETLLTRSWSKLFSFLSHKDAKYGYECVNVCIVLAGGHPHVPVVVVTRMAHVSSDTSEIATMNRKWPWTSWSWRNCCEN